MPDEPGGRQEKAATAEWRGLAAKFSTHQSGDDQGGRKGENKLARARRRQHAAQFKPFGGNGKNEKSDPPPGDIGNICSIDPQKRSTRPARGCDRQYESEQRRLSC